MSSTNEPRRSLKIGKTVPAFQPLAEPIVAIPMDSQKEWHTALVAILHLAQSYGQDMLNIDMSQPHEDVYQQLNALFSQVERALEVYEDTKRL